MRCLYLTLFILSAALALWFAEPRFIFGGGVVAKGVTAHKIRLIQLGMTKFKVVSVLGKPFFIETKDPQYFGAHASVMRYTLEPTFTSRTFPMLWIHLQDDKVVEVYAKRYILWGVDDEGVYGLSAQHGMWGGDNLEKLFPK